jgi:UDP-glucose 4-epimerase
MQGAGSARYNLGNGCGFTVREVIRAAERVTGRKIVVVEGARRDGDPSRLVADAECARRELGWKPEYSNLDAIISDAWRWELHHFGRAD